MRKQLELHNQVLKLMGELEALIDELKRAGSCKLDGWNALMNPHDWLLALAGRCDVERMTNSSDPARR